MAKTGLIYYNVDTNRYQDRRIKRLKKDFKCDGIAVYDYILCEIYRVEGCFLVWDEDTAFDVSEYFGLKETTVKEIVIYCGAVGLFDKTLLTRGIITSLSIQKRYLEMCKRAKRTNFEIPEDICIQEEQDKIPEETQKLPEVLPNTPEDIPQSKVKKSNIYIEDEQFFVSPVYVEQLNEMLSDTIYLEQAICMNMKIDLPTALNWIKRYYIKLTNEGTNEIKSFQDARYHFANWLRIQLKDEAKNQKGGKNGAVNGRKDTTSGSKSGKDYTKGF